jgi:hypothetical protein
MLAGDSDADHAMIRHLMMRDSETQAVTGATG